MIPPSPSLRYLGIALLFGHFLFGHFSSGGSSAWAAPQAPAAAPAGVAQPALQKSASWNWPDVVVYEELLASYLEQIGASEEQQADVKTFWNATAESQRGPEFLDRLLDAAGLVEPRVRKLNEELRAASAPPVQPRDLEWLTSDVPGWLQDTIRLACGRALAQRRMVDESFEALAGLQISQICDPATLLFYRASNEHHLLKKEECLANVRLLLERENEIPQRYAQVAKMIAADIQPLEADSLDEVARMMFDVHRRLDLGRAGQRVRDEEEDIVKKLDKLIEDIEQQLKQQQGKGSAGQSQGQAQRSGQLKPMEDSQAAGGSGPGDVDAKDIGERAGWGNLPPAQRQEALQRLTEELPSHYREVIEGYFRQLAKDRNAP
jgi:hypothetical protein